MSGEESLDVGFGAARTPPRNSSPPSGGRLGRHRLNRAQRKSHEKLVSGKMAEGVVVALETVEIEQGHKPRALPWPSGGVDARTRNFRRLPRPGECIVERELSVGSLRDV